MKKNWLHIFLAALLLCLLMAASPAMASKTTEKTKTKCDNCLKITDFIIIRYIPTPISSKPDPVAHWAEAKCKTCGNIQQFVLDDDRRFHTGGAETPTCTTGNICVKCHAEYGMLGHNWGAWVSNGDNKTHTRTCQRDGCSATDTANCSGDSTATCVVLGTCTECGGQCYGEHSFPETWKWSSDPYVERDAEKHWLRCMNDGCVNGRKDETDHRFVQGNMCLKSEATCVSTREYYVNCGSCYYQGTETYFDQYGTINPNNHDLKDYAAKASTCTEVGWGAYEACQRKGCSYSTYAEIPASGHSLTHHAGQAAACTEIGWEAYDTCSRCDYTTYVALPALGHDYQDEIIPRTCEDDGYTLHTCSRCQDSYTDSVIRLAGHWYGEWTANGDGTHSAFCQRGGCGNKLTVACASLTVPALDIFLCPVCGQASDGARLPLVSTSAGILSGRIPYGEPVLLLGTLANGERLLTVGYEYGGELSRPTGLVQITLPAALLSGCTLSLLNADGTETPVEFAIEGESAVFTLDFAKAEAPALALRLAAAN